MTTSHDGESAVKADEHGMEFGGCIGVSRHCNVAVPIVLNSCLALQSGFHRVMVYSWDLQRYNGF